MPAEFTRLAMSPTTLKRHSLFKMWGFSCSTNFTVLGKCPHDSVYAQNQQPAYDVILPINRMHGFMNHRVKMELTPLIITFNNPGAKFSIPVITTWACCF